MAVYRESESFIRQAIESILKQSFPDFELIIIDDFPENNANELLIKSISDSRIRYIKNEKNSGLAYSLNRAITASKGDFIARMDADDISDAERFKKQLDYFKSHPDTFVLGTWAQIIDEKNHVVGKFQTPTLNQHIAATTIIGSPFCHPSVMFRASFFGTFNYTYNEQFKYAQDYDLWARSASDVGFANLAEPLLAWRESNNRVSSKNNEEQNAIVKTIQKSSIRSIGIESSDRQLELHQQLYHCHFKNFGDMVGCFAWINELIQANNKAKRFDGYFLARVLLYHFRQSLASPWQKMIGLPCWALAKAFEELKKPK